MKAIWIFWTSLAAIGIFVPPYDLRSIGGMFLVGAGICFILHHCGWRIVL